MMTTTTTTPRLRLQLLALTVGFAAVAAVNLVAQRGGGGGGAAGGADAPMTLELGRLETLAQSFQLDRDQKSKVKTTLDAAQQATEPVRVQLTATRAALAAAIQAQKSQAEIDAAVASYAAQVTAMTAAETKALGAVLRVLTPEQRANAAAVQSAFFMFRGIFLGRRWDIVANGFYGY